MIDRIKALHWAEIIDSWRVFPRLFLLASFWWTVHLTHSLVTWYMMIPKEDRGIEASGFASVALLGALGFLKLVYSTYTSAGRDWTGPPADSIPIVQPPQ